MPDSDPRPRDPRHGHGFAKDPHTLAQQRRYRALCTALAEAQPFDDDSRRDVTERVCGIRSTAGLGRAEMARLIDEIARLARQAGASVRPARRRSRWTQDELIAYLAGQLGWCGHPERLEGFVRATFRGWQGGMMGLSVGQKSLLIVGLKRLIADQMAGWAKRERPLLTAQRPQRFRFVPGLV